MDEFITANGGRKVKPRISDIEKAFALQDALLNALKEGGIDVSGMKDGLQTEISDILPAILNSGIGILSSSDVRAKLFDCLVQFTYDGSKITQATFNEPEAREDYYEIAIACVKVNCSPFLKSLLSAFSSLGLDQEKLSAALK